MSVNFDAWAGQNKLLLDEFRSLWSEAGKLWDSHENTPAFERYVSADYEAVFHSLLDLQGRMATFVEWGSGLGVVAIMASRMGFEAYGIEAEPELVDHSKRLAMKYGPQTRFAQGSFIPDEYELSPAAGDDVMRTIIDLPSGYEDLDMRLRDFDLIYSYPWPDENTLCQNILRQCARHDASFLSYAASEGMSLVAIRDM